MKNLRLTEKPSMGIHQACYNFWAHYSDFKGKATRSEFWWNILALVIIFVLAHFINTITPIRSGYGYLFTMVESIFIFLIAVPILSIFTRRFHDAGYSGVLLTLYVMIEVVAFPNYELLKFLSWLAAKVGKFYQSLATGGMQQMQSPQQAQARKMISRPLFHNVFGMSVQHFLLIVMIFVAILLLYVLIQPSKNDNRTVQSNNSYHGPQRPEPVASGLGGRLHKADKKISKKLSNPVPNNFGSKPAVEPSLNSQQTGIQPGSNSVSQSQPQSHSIINTKHPGHWINN